MNVARVDMAEMRRRRLATLEEYLSFVRADNPAWWLKVAQRQDTFSNRLQREHGCGRDEGEQRLTSDTPIPTVSGVSGAPVHIRWSPEDGRHLVAARDIAAGEVVFREAPLVLVPRPDSAPVCLACLASLKSDWPACKGCGSPLCSPPCEGELHGSAECGLLACLGLQQDKRQLLLLNQLLTPLRTLLLLQVAPAAGPVMEALQSNTEKRRRAGVARETEHRVMDALRRLGIEKEEGVLRHICGVFDTNAFMVGGGRALLPLAALMNHHCGANTQHWYTRGALVVRAARDIPEGSTVTNTYAPALWGTRARAAFLASSKLFICRCPRCLDPRELGSHLSSVRCRQCQEGFMPPPAAPGADWQCEGCGAGVAAVAVEAMVCAAAVAATGATGDEVALQTVVRQLSRLVGGQHYVTAGAKRALVETIMAFPLHGVRSAYLKCVIDLCGDMLRAADLLDPGLSRYRGVLLLEEVRASAELLRREMSAGATLTEAVSSDPTFDATATITAAIPAATCDAVGEKVSGKPNPLLSLQRLTDAAKESERILLYDARLSDVQEVLHLLEDLQERQDNVEDDINEKDEDERREELDERDREREAGKGSMKSLE